MSSDSTAAAAATASATTTSSTPDTSILETLTSYAQAAYESLSKFADEVRANSEDDDTMISLEQLEKESSYESIQYHKSHTAPYVDYLKRKRIEKLIKDASSYQQTVMSLRRVKEHQHHSRTSSHAAAAPHDDNDTSAVDEQHERQQQHQHHSVNVLGGSTSLCAADEMIEQATRPPETVGENLAAQMEQRPHLIKWIVMILVAMLVGIFVALVQETTHALEEWRLDTVERWVMDARFTEKSAFVYSQAKGAVSWIGSAALLVLIGTGVVVFIEPVAGGSGLPQVMAFLNGVLVRNIFSLRTFVVKTISVIGAVAGGLPCGAEAPFVHLGASIGAGVSQGRSRALGFQTTLLQSLRGSKVRRDFTTAGAAAGVAAAFGSPIGGMLFVMEEAAVMWDLVTSTQIFLGSMTAFTAMAILDSLLISSESGGFVSRAASVMFQVEYTGTIPLNITAVIPAIALGAICGLLTVAFTKMNLYFVKLRNRLIAPNTTLKLLEPVLVVIVFAFLNFALPQILPCHKIVSHDESAGKLNGTQVESAAAWFTENQTKLRGYMCDDPQKEYSPLATLSTGLGKRSIRRLLSRRTVEEFPFYSVFIFFALYFSFATYINGSAIASGLIIPFIVMGSAVGRMFGLGLIDLFAQAVIDEKTGQVRSAYFFEDSWMDPGVYALIGAGAFVGGATRMTISIPVIMVELSGELRFLLPIMVAIAVARGVADTLCVPLYHQLLHLVCVPYLPHSATGVNLDMFTLRSVVAQKQQEQLVAAEQQQRAEQQAQNRSSMSSMSSSSSSQRQLLDHGLVWLPHRPTLQQILDTLESNTHHVFPVLEMLPSSTDGNNNSSGGGSADPTNTYYPLPPHRLHGTVSREDLQIMLALPDFDIGPHAMTRYRPNRPYNELRYEEWLEHENSLFFLVSTAQWQQMWKSHVPNLSSGTADAVEKGNKEVDLSLILNQTPFTTHIDSNLAETYATFRTQALRHLLVTSKDQIVGIVTRKDLLPYRLRKLQAKNDTALLAGVGLTTSHNHPPPPPPPQQQQQQPQEMALGNTAAAAAAAAAAPSAAPAAAAEAVSSPPSSPAAATAATATAASRKNDLSIFDD